MSTQSTSSESNSVIPLAPRARTAVSDAHELDKAGQTILGLLHKRPAWLKRTAERAGHGGETFASASRGRGSDRRVRGRG